MQIRLITTVVCVLLYTNIVFGEKTFGYGAQRSEDERLEINRKNVSKIVSKIDSIIPGCDKIVYSHYEVSYYIACNDDARTEFYASFSEDYDLLEFIEIRHDSIYDARRKELGIPTEFTLDSCFEPNLYPAGPVTRLPKSVHMHGHPTYFCLLAANGERQSEIMLWSRVYPSPIQVWLDYYMSLSMTKYQDSQKMSELSYRYRGY